MTDKVSVVITSHNLERYIGEAIESVLSQDYEGPVEVIVVDDFSTDGSAEVIRSYPEIVYLATPENLGVLMATVYGMRHCSGDIVFFLDGDDTWRNDKLRICMQLFNSDTRIGLVTHDLAYVDRNGRMLNKPSRPSRVFGGNNFTGERVRCGILEHTDYVWLGSAYAIRRSNVDAEGFCTWAEHLPDPFNTYQDWPLAYWVASQSAVNLAFVPEKLFSYRLHGQNHSGDAGSVRKVLRNLKRTFNTMVAIKEIVDRTGLQGNARVITLRKLAYYEYLLDLYSGRRAIATRKFLAAQPFLLKSSRGLIKEWVRFIGVQLLGVQRFVRGTALNKGVVS